MYSILILENLWRQNSIILEYLCRVHKIKHTATGNFAECFIEAHGKGDGRSNGVTGRHLCCVSDVRHTAKILPLPCAHPLPWVLC